MQQKERLLFNYLEIFEPTRNGSVISDIPYCTGMYTDTLMSIEFLTYYVNSNDQTIAVVGNDEIADILDSLFCNTVIKEVKGDIDLFINFGNRIDTLVPSLQKLDTNDFFEEIRESLIVFPVYMKPYTGILYTMNGGSGNIVNKDSRQLKNVSNYHDKVKRFTVDKESGYDLRARDMILSNFLSKYLVFHQYEEPHLVLHDWILNKTNDSISYGSVKYVPRPPLGNQAFSQFPQKGKYAVEFKSALDTAIRNLCRLFSCVHHADIDPKTIDVLSSVFDEFKDLSLNPSVFDLNVFKSIPFVDKNINSVWSNNDETIKKLGTILNLNPTYKEKVDISFLLFPSIEKLDQYLGEALKQTKMGCLLVLLTHQKNESLENVLANYLFNKDNSFGVTESVVLDACKKQQNEHFWQLPKSRRVIKGTNFVINVLAKAFG